MRQTTLVNNPKTETDERIKTIKAVDHVFMPILEMVITGTLAKQ